MPVTYQNHGVQFLYPETWTLTDEHGGDWPRSVALETPNSGFFTLQIHRGSTPGELAEQALQALREEYPTVEADSALERVEGQELTGFDLHFYYLDFVIAARVRAVRHGTETLVWLFQAEDREFDELEPVVLAIETSLLRSLAAGA